MPTARERADPGNQAVAEAHMTLACDEPNSTLRACTAASRASPCATDIDRNTDRRKRPRRRRTRRCQRDRARGGRWRYVLLNNAWTDCTIPGRAACCEMITDRMFRPGTRDAPPDTMEPCEWQPRRTGGEDARWRTTSATRMWRPATLRAIRRCAGRSASPTTPTSNRAIWAKASTTATSASTIRTAGGASSCASTSRRNPSTTTRSPTSSPRSRCSSRAGGLPVRSTWTTRPTRRARERSSRASARGIRSISTI